MTDRELLEAAAKAAGIETGKWISDINEAKGAFFPPSGRCWNPLTDDGDALRLAVKLGLTIEVLNRRMEPHTRCAELEEGHWNDPYAATRRAIVRAAAEIGVMNAEYERIGT